MRQLAPAFLRGQRVPKGRPRVLTCIASFLAIVCTLGVVFAVAKINSPTDDQGIRATWHTRNTTRTTCATGTDLNWRGRAVLPELDATLYMFGLVALEDASSMQQSLEFQGFLEDFIVTESRRAHMLEERFPVGDGTLEPIRGVLVEAVTSSSWWQLKEGICTVTLANGRVSKGHLRLKHPVSFGRPYKRHNTHVLTFECAAHFRQYLCNETGLQRVAELDLTWPVAGSRAVFTDVDIPCASAQMPELKDNTVAMCLPPLSKDFQPGRLLEFTAYHSSLGVKYFHFFSKYAHTTDMIRKMFDQAPSLGTHTITESSFSEHGQPEVFEYYWYYEHLLWINFCARNLARNATWVTNVEMDEYLVVPASHNRSVNSRPLGSFYSDLLGSSDKDILVIQGPHVACDGSERFVTHCTYLRNMTGRAGPQPLRPKSVFRPQTFEYAGFHGVYPDKSHQHVLDFPTLVHFVDGSSQRTPNGTLAISKERFDVLLPYTEHHDMMNSMGIRW